MFNSKTRWKYPEFVEEEVSHLQEELHITSLVAKLFQTRGWTDIAEAKSFLHTKDQAFHDPFLLQGMGAAVERIKQAVANQEKIRIYGDYDCDGVTSTTLMIHVLQELGAHFDYYIPDRFTEGYGLNHKALHLAQAEGVRLIITVDTGIAAKNEVAFGMDLGLDFIITDHHEVPAEMPECVAVINPKQESCTYPYPYLAGVGVAFKLGQALLERIPSEYLDLAAIGTIADLVPLTGENRLIVYHGLKTLNQTQHVGLEALIEIAGLRDKYIHEEHIGFSIGPRLNASGRIAKADKAVHLLTARDQAEAMGLATEIEELNKERQKLVEQITKEAIGWVENTYGEEIPPCLVVAQEDWHIGVIGIVASRLIRRYYVPTIILSIDQEEGEAKGSARSIEGFDVYQALQECRESLTHFGGHPQAAGLSLPREQIDQLRQHLIELASKWLTEEDFIPSTQVDVCCQVGEISLKAVEELESLAPFGVGNPKPIFLLEKLYLKEFRAVGADGSHLKCVVEQEESTLDAIGFGWGEVVHQISQQARIDLLGELNINEWNGQKKPQILIQDLRVSEQQLFDWRGVKNIPQQWARFVFEERIALCLARADTPMPSDLPSYIQPIFFNPEGGLTSASVQLDVNKIDTFIMYDLPHSLSQGRQIFQCLSHAQRFYLIFQQEKEHFFSSLPSREYFKRYYAFLKRQSSFDLQRDGGKLARHMGWTVDSLHFMTAVFAELQFATWESGVVSLRDNPQRKDLSDSSIYQQKLAEIELEKELVYSSYTDLHKMIHTWIGNKKEAMVYEL